MTEKLKSSPPNYKELADAIRFFRQFGIKLPEKVVKGEIIENKQLEQAIPPKA